MINNLDIYNFLKSNIDNKYKNFSSRLIPNSKNLLGVRLPVLRSYAKKLAKENNVNEYLSFAKCNYFEEIMLQGFVIGYYKSDISTIINYCKNFIPKIDNWSICDSFCNSLKITHQYHMQMWNYISNYKSSNKTYELRFMIVMFLCYYIDLPFLDKIFDIILNIESKDYYVQMAIAWLLSACYVKYPKETINFLTSSNIDKFTYNKTLQKIIESNRVPAKQKEMIKIMKK